MRGCLLRRSVSRGGCNKIFSFFLRGVEVAVVLNFGVVAMVGGKRKRKVFVWCRYIFIVSVVS